MDPSEPQPANARFETFDANDRFVVVRDDDGYAVWRLEDLEDGDALDRFDDTDAGYEAASGRWRDLTKEDRRRRAPWLRWIMWIVLVSAALWAVSSAVSAVLFFQVSGVLDGQGIFETLVRWSQLVSVVATSTTVGGFAVYAVLWLESRR
jgi:hypothetical protein